MGRHSFHSAPNNAWIYSQIIMKLGCSIMPAESIRSLYFPISNPQQHPRKGRRNFEVESKLNTSSSNFVRNKPLKYVQFMLK